MNLPGFGDEITWGFCTGHPLDPRTIDIDNDGPYPHGLDQDAAFSAAMQLNKRHAYWELSQMIEACRNHGTPEADNLAADAIDWIEHLGLEAFK